MFLGVRQDTAVPITDSASHGARHVVGLHHPRFLPADESIRQLALALAAGYFAGAQLAER
jgi:amidohydrolase